MDISSLMFSQDLAGLLITLTGQSIIVSLIGIAVIKLLSKQSAPVRSLVCAATMTALSLLMVISIGFRLSDISRDKPHSSILLEENTSTRIVPSKPGKTLPFVSVHLPSRIQSRFSDGEGLVQSIAPPSPFSFQLTPTESLIINVMGFIWLTGIMFLLVRLCFMVVLSEKFRNNLLVIKDTAINSMVRNVAGTFWNKRLPGLYRSPLIESPIAIGLFNPIVVIPEKLFAALSENELKSILLHELSHIYHYDQLIGVIKKFVMAFYWWSPFVYKINRYHEQAREEVSDNYVLRELHPKVYSRCLMDLAEKVCLISSCPTAVGMAGRRFDLGVRVEQLLSKKRRVVMNTKSYLKAIAFSICLVLTFTIAGLYANVTVEAIDDTTGKELPEIRRAINPAAIFDEKQHPARKNITEPEVIMTSVPDNSQEISKTKTATHANFLNKRDQESERSIGMLASAGTKTEEIIEKQDAAERNGDVSQKEVNAKKAPVADAYISNGVSNLKRGRTEDAVADFSRAIALEPQNAVAYTARGSAYFRLNQFDNAISDYDKAIKIKPDLAAAYQNRGSAYYRQGQFDSAISDYNRALEINPGLAASYQDRGSIYLIQHRFDEAISDYDKAIALNPDNADIYNLRGNTYLTKGQIDKAIDDYTRAIEINPRLAVAYYNRGSAYNFDAKIEMASNDYKKALELNPGFGKTNDDREIVCRRDQATTGTILPKEYCATKSQWAAGLEHGKIPGVTTITRQFPGDSLLDILQQPNGE